MDGRIALAYAKRLYDLAEGPQGPQGEPGSGAVGTVAEAYSTSKTYAVGDYVIHDEEFYRCTTAITTAEAFNSAHWTKLVLTDEVSDLKSDITNLEELDKSIINISLQKTDGYINDVNGEVVSNTAYWYSQDITVEKGDVISAKLSGRGASAIAFYNSNGTYIRSESLPFVQGQEDYSLAISEGGHIVASSLYSYTTPSVTIYRYSDLVNAVNNNTKYVLAHGEEFFSLNKSILSTGKLDLTYKRSEAVTDNSGNIIPIDTPVYEYIAGRYGLSIMNGSSKANRPKVFVNMGAELDEIGVGLTFKPNTSTIADEIFLFNIWEDDDNYIRVYYRKSQHKIYATVTKNGAVVVGLYTPYDRDITISENDVVSVYFDIRNDNSIHFYISKNGMVSVSTLYYISDIIPKVNRIYFGGYFTDGDIYSVANCIFADLKIDVEPNGMAYFEEVL